MCVWLCFQHYACGMIASPLIWPMCWSYAITKTNKSTPPRDGNNITDKVKTFYWKLCCLSYILNRLNQRVAPIHFCSHCSKCSPCSSSLFLISLALALTRTHSPVFSHSLAKNSVCMFIFKRIVRSIEDIAFQRFQNSFQNGVDKIHAMHILFAHCESIENYFSLCMLQLECLHEHVARIAKKCHWKIVFDCTVHILTEVNQHKLFASYIPH